MARYLEAVATVEPERSAWVLPRAVHALSLFCRRKPLGALGGFLVLVMLCFALAEGLITLGIWPWAAFLIVAGVCVLLASVALLVVYLKVRRISGLRQTRETVQEDLAVLRREDNAPLPAAAEAG